MYIPRYKGDIIVITRVWGGTEDKNNNCDIIQDYKGRVSYFCIACYDAIL